MYTVWVEKVNTIFPLFPVLCFQLLITQIFFNIPWRFELWGLNCVKKKGLSATYSPFTFFFNIFFFLQVTVNLLIRMLFCFCCFAFTYGKNIVRIYTQELSKVLSLPSPIDSLDPFDQILALTFYADGLKI